MTAEQHPNTPHIVVIGGGITGLTAAWALSNAHHTRNPSARNIEPRITVLEGSGSFGGMIRTTEFAGLPVDLGADAFLSRVPWATQLCNELGITHDLVSPAKRNAWLWTHNQLLPFPDDTVLGVPSHLRKLFDTKIVSRNGYLRSLADLVLPEMVGRTKDDPTIAELTGKRLGKEVLTRLIEPLLGGINAGRVDRLSLASTAPQLAEIAASNRSLVLGVRDELNRRDPEEANAPVFYAPKGGMSRLVQALAFRLVERSVTLYPNTEVSELHRKRGEWIVQVGERQLRADAVLLATPASVSARLIEKLSPEAARLFGGISHASVSMLRLAYQRSDIARALDGSGFVVPAVDNRLLTACSWASSKWSHLDTGEYVIMRASAGRYDDERPAQLSDEELVDAIHQELEIAIGVSGRPVVSDVTRWEGAFPQYEPGHGARILALERIVGSIPGLAFAGAAYRGLGIPSCIRNAREAADSLLGKLATSQDVQFGEQGH